MSATILQQILHTTRAEVAERKRVKPLDALAAELASKAGTAGGVDGGTVGVDGRTVGGTGTRARGGTVGGTGTRARGGAVGVDGRTVGGTGTRARKGTDAISGARISGRLRDALIGPEIAVIAEIKRRSPSAGDLRAQLDVAALAHTYASAGASAISVLTEGPHFGGSLEDLRAARATADVPILRKDFIVDPYQLHEAAVAGADGVLLIVAALSEEELSDLHARACSLGLDSLVEVHDEAELATALAAGADLVGINNRDLRDFTVDVERTYQLMGEMPSGVTVVSESGISAPEQLQRLHAAGVSAVLVGGALMRADDPGSALRALLGGAAGASGR